MTRARTTLRADPRSARAARRFVTSTLTRWKCQHVADMVALLTSELVTNAVVHARSGVRLTLVLGRAAVRVEVADDAPGRPVLRRAGPESLSGRGLTLLDAIADRWGVEHATPGKSVWFEVRR